MTKNWEVKTLGDVCVYVSRGISPKYTKSNGLIVVNQKCVRDHIVNFDLARLHNVKEKKVSDEKRIQKGDVLINSTGTGTLGRVAHVTEDVVATVDSHITIVRPNKDILDERFFAWTLFNIENQIEASATGTSGQTELPRTAVNGFVVSYPRDKKEQKRIVKILDEKFELIEKLKSVAKEQIEGVKELFENRLNELLFQKDKDWIDTVLGDLCESVQYGSSSKSKQKGKVPVLRMGNIQGGQIDWKKLVYTDNEQEIKKYLLKKDDILFNRTNSPELVGKTAIYKGEKPAIFAGYLIRINRKESYLDAGFLNYYLNSSFAKKYGASVMNRSTNQANINGAKLKKYPISVPPLNKQKYILQELDILKDHLKDFEEIFHKKVTELEELKKSYLHEAFSGKL